jgi:hypothetical protein
MGASSAISCGEMGIFDSAEVKIRCKFEQLPVHADESAHMPGPEI